MTGDVVDGVERFAQRDDVVGQRAAHPAFDLVGRAEVDHPGVQPGGVQNADRAFAPG